MSFILRIFTSLIFILSIPLTGWNYKHIHWRYWNPNDCLGKANTPSNVLKPLDQLLTTHGDGKDMNWLDGYHLHPIPSPGNALSVFKQQSSLIASLYKDRNIINNAAIRDRLYYSFRIDDDSWSPLQLETVTPHIVLVPGKYQFHVRTVDRNGNQDRTPIILDCTVLPMWYTEPVVIILMSCSLILIVTLLGFAINRHIELRNCKNTLKKTQNLLIQSEKMASLGQLIAGVAHEINNPINFIKSNIQPLKEYLQGFKNICTEVIQKKERMPDDLQEEFNTSLEKNDIDYSIDDCEKLVQSFQEGSDRIAKIVGDLRLYSRSDEDFFSDFDIHEAIEASLTLLYNRYKNRVTINKEYATLPTVKCSPGKINQVFLNLLSNAIESIEEEGNVWIATRRINDNVVVTVRDDGKGITPEHLSKIFDPFFTTKPVGSGTGLGLSLSHDIIEQHGGTISVDSELAKGTTFTVTLSIHAVTY